MQKRLLLLLAVMLCWTSTRINACSESFDSKDYFEIQVIDRSTQRGVPMVALTTVDDVTYYTDSAGRVALREPELEGQELFFKIDSPGYRASKDGFGMEGVRLKIEHGQAVILKIDRVNLAERLYRITGRDIYLDSIRLGHSVPLKHPLVAGKVVGQDSVQTVRIGERLFWFWGDTNRISYPLGLFRTAGAVSLPVDSGGLAPQDGIDFEYFTGPDGFAREMIEVADKKGVVWIHGVCSVQDKNGALHVVTQYTRRKGLAESLEIGMAEWNFDRERFEVLDVLGREESWQIVRDHPLLQTMNGINYLAFGGPFPMTRVPATLEEVRNRDAYESFTCREELNESNPSKETLEKSKPKRNADGSLQWRWAKAPPVTQHDERRWLRQGLIKMDEARLLPRAIDEKDRIVELHAGTIAYNPWRKRWVMIANEQALDKSSPSYLGEVFYCESDSPQGPFIKGLKVATHPGQSFYNPCHHPFFDQAGGKLIYFEGTYCNSFTKSPATPKYNYNQLMYRLDLSSLPIESAFGPPGQ